MKSVAQKWIDLGGEGYGFHVRNKDDLRKFTNPSRVWKRIFSRIDLPLNAPSGGSVFEFGSGGGQHLLMLALHGWRAVGIDCVHSATEGAKEFFEEAKKVSGGNLSANFIEGDFLEFAPNEKYDIVFHNGVLEHFLDEEERLLAIGKMFEITKSGGYVISMVPSGMHPLRQRVRAEGLGGYLVPEIDYTDKIMREEFEKMSGEKIEILAHNIFGYLLSEPGSRPGRFARRIFYYFFQLIPPSFLPKRFAFRHSGTIIGISKKK